MSVMVTSVRYNWLCKMILLHHSLQMNLDTLYFTYVHVRNPRTPSIVALIVIKWAALYCQADICEFLLHMGVDANRVDEWGK